MPRILVVDDDKNAGLRSSQACGGASCGNGGRLDSLLTSCIRMGGHLAEVISNTGPGYKRMSFVGFYRT